MKKFFIIILVSAVTLLSGCGNAKSSIENTETAGEDICENELEGLIMENLEWILILMAISITGCCVGAIVFELLKNRR